MRAQKDKTLTRYRLQKNEIKRKKNSKLSRTVRAIERNTVASVITYKRDINTMNENRFLNIS